MAKIRSICISAQKKMAKHEIPLADVSANWGIETDAHAGHGHRQISLLSWEAIEAFCQKKGISVEPGAFSENLVLEDCDVAALPVGTRLLSGEVLLEVTQIGKACRKDCPVVEKLGDCLLPRQGAFVKVLHGGILRAGDEVSILPLDPTKRHAAVITLSDKGSKGECLDESGPLVVKTLTEAGYEVVEILILPNQEVRLKRELIRLSDRRQCHLILTTGGASFAPRDIAPEATMAVATRNAPGIAEAIRLCSLSLTPRGMLNRGVSVIRNQTLIVNLPGSLKAAKEALEFILPSLARGIDMLRGIADENTAL